MILIDEINRVRIQEVIKHYRQDEITNVFKSLN